MCDSGIYKISFKENDSFYIGSTVGFKRRERDHLRSLSRNKHKNIIIQNAYNKYGKDSFKFEILAKCPPEYRVKLEQWFIDKLKPSYNILNRATGGKNQTLTDREIAEIKYLLSRGYRCSNICKFYKTNRTIVCTIKNGTRYQNIKALEEFKAPEGLVLHTQKYKPFKATCLATGNVLYGESTRQFAAKYGFCKSAVGDALRENRIHKNHRFDYLFII